MAIPEASVSAVVAQAASGDQVAFARLVAQHHPAMARVAYAITGERESAADAVQVAWATAWRRLGGLRDRTTVRAWLIAIAANEARQHVRRQRRRTIVDISSVPEASAGGDPADRITAFGGWLRGS